jgi:hypothetical protein
VREHIAAENVHDIELAIATFHHPRHEVAPFGEVQNYLLTREVNPSIAASSFRIGAKETTANGPVSGILMLVWKREGHNVHS